MPSTHKIHSLLALALLVSLTACERPTTVGSAPPPELVLPLPADPQVPVERNEATTAGYINALRDFGRIARARYDALVIWATAPR